MSMHSFMITFSKMIGAAEDESKWADMTRTEVVACSVVAVTVHILGLKREDLYDLPVDEEHALFEILTGEVRKTLPCNGDRFLVYRRYMPDDDKANKMAM